MAKEKYCLSCNSKFNIFRWRNNCSFCGGTFCSNCYSKINVPRDLRVDPMQVFFADENHKPESCNSCFDSKHLKKIEVKINESVGQYYSIDTYPKSYKGQTAVSEENNEWIYSEWFRDRDECEKQLKITARFLGSDAVDMISYNQDTGEEPSDSGKGVHKYSIWQGKGRVNSSTINAKDIRTMEETIRTLPGLNKDTPKKRKTSFS